MPTSSNLTVMDGGEAEALCDPYEGDFHWTAWPYSSANALLANRLAQYLARSNRQINRPRKPQQMPHHHGTCSCQQNGGRKAHKDGSR